MGGAASERGPYVSSRATRGILCQRFEFAASESLVISWTWRVGTHTPKSESWGRLIDAMFLQRGVAARGCGGKSSIVRGLVGFGLVVLSLNLVGRVWKRDAALRVLQVRASHPASVAATDQTGHKAPAAGYTTRVPRSSCPPCVCASTERSGLDRVVDEQEKELEVLRGQIESLNAKLVAQSGTGGGGLGHESGTDPSFISKHAIDPLRPRSEMLDPRRNFGPIHESLSGALKFAQKPRELARIKKEYNCGYGPKPRITAWHLVSDKKRIMDDAMEAAYEAASLDAEEWYLPPDDQYEQRVQMWVHAAKAKQSITVGYISAEKISPWVRAHHGAATRSLFSLVFPEYNVRVIPLETSGFPFKPVPPHAPLLPNGLPHIITGTGFFLDESIKPSEGSPKKVVPSSDAPTQKWRHGAFFDSDKINVVDGRPLIVAYDNEPWTGSCMHEDIVINCKREPTDSGCVNLVQPHAVQWWYQRERRFPLEQSKPADAEAILKDKTNFLAFMVKHCDNDGYPATAALRTALFDIVSEDYKPGDSIGNCRKPTDLQADWRYREGNNADILRPFKFAIAFESTYAPEYHTEKLLNAIIGRTVPVYFGADTVSKHFNPKRFIHCKFSVDEILSTAPPYKGEDRVKHVKKVAGSELRACVEQIKKVDKDDELWKAMVREPMLPNNSINGTGWDLRPLAGDLRRVIDLYEPSWLPISN